MFGSWSKWIEGFLGCRMNSFFESFMPAWFLQMDASVLFFFFFITWFLSLSSLFLLIFVFGVHLSFLSVSMATWEIKLFSSSSFLFNSSVTFLLRKVSRKLKILNRMWYYCCFIYTRHLFFLTRSRRQKMTLSAPVDALFLPI